MTSSVHSMDFIGNSLGHAIFPRTTSSLIAVASITFKLQRGGVSMLSHVVYNQSLKRASDHTGQKKGRHEQVVDAIKYLCLQGIEIVVLTKFSKH